MYNLQNNPNMILKFDVSVKKKKCLLQHDGAFLRFLYTYGILKHIIPSRMTPNASLGNKLVIKQSGSFFIFLYFINIYIVLIFLNHCTLLYI